MRRIGTQREKRIAKALASGQSNKEISNDLGITEKTVKWYIGGLMRSAGLYGNGDERRLVVLAVKGKLERKGLNHA